MPNTEDGRRLLEERSRSEGSLRTLDPRRYEKIEHWYDHELYGGLCGHGGGDRIPAAHKPLIMQLLQSRAAVYRGRKSGAIEDDRGRDYDSEIGNEQLAQTIDNCLAFLGDGPNLPLPDKDWHDFMPDWA